MYFCFINSFYGGFVVKVIAYTDFAENSTEVSYNCYEICDKKRIFSMVGLCTAYSECESGRRGGIFDETAEMDWERQRSVGKKRTD